MSKLLLCSLATAALVECATSFPSHGSIQRNSSMLSRPIWARDEDFDESDLSFITRLAAVGDSYSAGIGAGSHLGSILNALDPQSDWACRRYDSAYPYLLNTDGRLGDSSKRKFQFESCSGAVTKDILETQIPRIDSNQQVILLSAGGNDAELVKILNKCIFQWAVLNKDQVAVAKLLALDRNFAWAKDYDWDLLGLTCEEQLDRTQSIIDSGEFSKDLDTLINAAKAKLASDGVIYYTGYAKFFAEDMSSDCDKVSWATWYYKLYNLFHGHQYLTSANRRAMNSLVDAMNSKLADAVKRAGPSVTFVNYDQYTGRWGGRFCEKGVDEATTVSNTRKGLMFYELNSWDVLGLSPWKRSNDDPLKGTFDGDQEILAQITLIMDEQAKFTQEEANTGSFVAAKNAALASSSFNVQVPNLLPDGQGIALHVLALLLTSGRYGRVFHPQILLHQLISNLIIYHMVDRNLQTHGFPSIPEIETIDSCPLPSSVEGRSILRYQNTEKGKSVSPGTELRILGIGDSITVGFLADHNAGEDGYRLKLRDDLSEDKVVFAGTETSDGTMTDGYFAAWSGKTIKYISDHIGPSLKQRPNIILLHAGTNDMNPSSATSQEGNDPSGAAERLGKLIDYIVDECPDATVLVAMIINSCLPDQGDRIKSYQALIPGVVKTRRYAGKHVIAADFTTFQTSWLGDCLHPSREGYKVFGDYWYDFISQIPKKWITKPQGEGPNRGNGLEANGGIDKNIPPPDLGQSPVQVASPEHIQAVYRMAPEKPNTSCTGRPEFHELGQIGRWVGKNGDWMFHQNWKEAGNLAQGLGLDPRYVRLHDMNGDGKADYLWIHPTTGQIRCWINNLPNPWTPAGSNNDGVIGDGRGPADRIYIADMNGDGMADYMVVDPNTGGAKIWWNFGPDNTWANGWRWYGEGAQVANGVPHANLKTLRFADMNGDGRADYVYIGEGGSLRLFLNIGTVGGQDVLWLDQGGIATGAAPDITNLVFADINGDGRDDYLIFDDDAGLTGYLNQPTQKEGIPHWMYQGPPKSIAYGVFKNVSTIRLADMDGDGKDDYIHVDSNGGLSVWYNQGGGDTRMLTESVRFAKFYSDAPDCYIWLDPDSGAPYVYLNYGADPSVPLGYHWIPRNDYKPSATGAAPAAQVQFGDIDGDGVDDYLVVHPQTGELTVYLNEGEDKTNEYGWRFRSIGSIASGLGPGANVRFADIDGDGRVDYIYMHPYGGTTIYLNGYSKTAAGPYWHPVPAADASGIFQRPEEISFQDINHDGKADYVWTRARDGAVFAWLNNYPNQPPWLEFGQIADGVGTTGSNVKWAELTRSGYPDYVAFNPADGSFAAWLNLCPKGQSVPDPTTEPPPPPPTSSPYYDCKGESLCSTTPVKFCDKAVNETKRGDIYESNREALVYRGNCYGNLDGYGCSVQIRGTDRNGKNCKITGDEMWQAYQDIRKSGDCRMCGSKHFGNGCLVSVDYFVNCSNRTGGLRLSSNATEPEDQYTNTTMSK